MSKSAEFNWRGRLTALLFVSLFVFVNVIGSIEDAEARRKKKKKGETPVQTLKEEDIEAVLAKTVEKTPYFYEPRKRRDPFMSIVEISKRRLEQIRKKKRKRVLLPLERYKLSDLKVIGIITDNIGSYASVVTPDGKSYTVRRGSPMGLYGGYVSDIRPDRILVKEESYDYYGKIIVNITEIKLREEESE